MGRPTKLTPEVQQRIVQAIQMGATYELACKYGGVSYDAFNEWRNKGDAASTGVYRQFCDAINDAEGKAAVSWLAKIEKAATDGAWQAAAWKLERRYPHDYGKQVQEISGPNGNPVPIQHIMAVQPNADHNTNNTTDTTIGREEVNT